MWFAGCLYVMFGLGWLFVNLVLGLRFGFALVGLLCDMDVVVFLYGDCARGFAVVLGPFSCVLGFRL